MTVLDEGGKERLVEQFRAGLDAIDGEFEDDDGGEPVDLRSLLEEMAVLRSELRIQSRQFKAALDELQSQGQTLREHHQRDRKSTRLNSSHG